MKQFITIILFLIILSSHGFAIDPVIQTEWLDENMESSGIVILDIRTGAEYKAGHIPGAVNVPSPSWWITKDNISVEFPDNTVLFYTIGAAGIQSDSSVVLVNRSEQASYVTDTTRVAITLLYAGVRNVSVLDGGYTKWVKEGRTVSTSPVLPVAVVFTGEIDRTMIASKEYVEKHAGRKHGRTVIIDARDPDVYFGITNSGVTARAGHIPGAVNLPTPWLWFTIDGAGIYKSVDELKEMVNGTAGRYQFREIIIYCGVGKYASTAFFVIKQVLGYQNVKIYDGSAQEWSADPAAPLILYRWE